MAAELVCGDANLFHRVAFADGDGLVFESLAVHGDAEGRSRFVLAAVAPTDRTLFVVETVQGFLQVVVDVPRDLRHAVLSD